MKGDPRAWRTIGTYLFVHEAALAAGRLEQEGIEARILDAELVGVAPHLALSIGGVRLQVHGFDEAVAKQLLATEQALIHDEEGEEPDEAPAPNRNRLATKALLAALLGVSFAPLVGTWFSLAALVDLHRSRGAGEEMRFMSKMKAGFAVVIDLVAVVLVVGFLQRGGG